MPAHVSDKDVGGGQGAVLLLLQLALQLQPQVGDVQLGDHSVFKKNYTLFNNIEGCKHKIKSIYFFSKVYILMDLWRKSKENQLYVM